MNAAEIVKARGGRWNGIYGTCRCPAHDDRNPSLSVSERNGKLLVKCHAGCSQDLVVDALRADGIELTERSSRLPHRQRRQPAKTSHGSQPDDNRRVTAALEIWRETRTAEPYSHVASYLQSRGITIPIPPSLRSHSALKHGPADRHFPAMVVGVQGPDRNFTAIHRTYLVHSGRAKAVVSAPKMAFGPIGAGAVRLGYVTETLMLTEGIEDGLALIQMTGGIAWALLGSSNFKNFIPPAEVKTIILAPDADPAGDAAVAEAAARFSGMGLRVMHLRPPDGSDWCDCLDIFEERAAIAEFDGHVERANAELAVFAEIVGGEVRHAA